MWKREVKDDYLDNLGKCFTCLNFLWKSDNAPIYIMDNHLAAAWCWMQECNTEEKYNFMHIDQHDDLGACGFTKDIESLRTTPHISINEYDKITYTTLGGEFKFFKCDNYIRACHFLFPQWFNTNLFYYAQSSSVCSLKEWGYSDFIKQRMEVGFVGHDITQFIKDNIFPQNEIVIENNMRTKKWIVNIDLDFFWDANKKRVYDDQFVSDLGITIGNAMNNIQVLTIALSPKWCGGWKNALEVSKVFLSCHMLRELCNEYFEEKELFISPK